MKKMLSFLCILLTAFLLLSFSVLAESQSAVVDQAGIFSESEVNTLEQKISNFISAYDMDLLILTSQKSHSNSAYDYAEDYYSSHNCGIGRDSRGILLFYDLYKSDFVLYTYGLANSYLTDSRLDDFEAKFPSRLRKAKNGEENYGKAFSYAIELITGYCKNGIPAESRAAYNSRPARRLTLTKIIVSALIAVGTGLIISFATIGSYKLKGSTYRYDYRKNGEVNITHRVDQFLRTTHTHVRIPRNPPPSSHGGHGGGSHSFSGGHGGGGGRSMHI